MMPILEQMLRFTSAFAAAAGAVFFVAFLLIKHRQLRFRKGLKEYVRPRTNPKILQKLEGIHLKEYMYYFEHIEHRGLPFLIRGPEQEMVRLEDDEIEVRVEVTPYLCSRDAGGLYLSCATLLAIMDDVSSYCQTWSDKELRWGISLALDTEVCHPVTAGETITVCARSLKQGRSLAWLDIWVVNEQGITVARGHHLKYIRIDLWYIMLFNRVLFKYIGMALAPVDLSIDRRRVPELPQLVEYFRLKETLHEDGSLTAPVAWHKDFLNDLNIIHGGALAMIAEQAALAQSKWTGAGGRRIRRMKMSYMAPVGHNATVVASSPEVDGSAVVRFMKGNKVLTQCRLMYDDTPPESGPRNFASKSRKALAM